MFYEVGTGEQSEFFGVALKGENEVGPEDRFVHVVETDVLAVELQGVMDMFAAGWVDPEFAQVGIVENILFRGRGLSPLRGRGVGGRNGC